MNNPKGEASASSNASANPSTTVATVAVDKSTADKPKVELTSEMNRLLSAERTVMRNSQWSLLAGLVPFSFLDIAAISGVHAKMIYELCKIYDTPFEKQRVKTLIGALVGGLATTGLASSMLGSAARSIPVVGGLIGMATQPALAYGSSVAIGKVFISHFESGGTLLDFDPSTMRQHYADEFAKASASAPTAATEKAA
nr:GTPase domain-containing protein [uncultured bacterium]